MSPSTFLELAQLMRAKYKEGALPYVLFLGTAASQSSGCSAFSDIVKDVVGSDDPTAFFDLLDRRNPDERALLLRTHLQGSSPSSGYRHLAELVKAGYFDVILTTNVDSLLETSLVDAGLRPSDYVCMVNGKDRDEEIARLMKQHRSHVRILKLHGDLELGILAIMPTETFQFSRLVGDALREHLNRDVVIVGYGPWDSHDVSRCLELSRQSMWYVAPDRPAQSSVIYQALVARKATPNIISGEEGQFDHFFKALRDVLIQPESVSAPTLTQEIERRGPFEPEEAARLTIDGLRDILERDKRLSIRECIWQAIRLCTQLEQHHAQGFFHHDLNSDNVVVVDVGYNRHARWVEKAVLAFASEAVEGEANEDVYAVAAILYEMLTGYPPPPDSAERASFSGASSWVRFGLDQIVLKALASEPAERYCDVVILRERLYHHLSRLKQAEEIDTLIRASYPIVYIVSWEEERVSTLLRQVAEMEDKPFYSWTLSQGLRDAKGRQGRGATGPENPAAVLDQIIRAKEEALYALFDFHRFLRPARQASYDLIRRRLRDLAAEARHSGKAVVIVAPVLEIPPECEKDITVMHLGLPTPGEIADVLDNAITLILKSGGQIQLARGDYEELVRSATGLTLTGAERAFAQAFVRKAIEKDRAVLDRDGIEIVVRDKERALYRSGALEVFSSQEDFDDIGGLEALKDWVAKRASAFSIEAQDFGLPAPKGVLLIGVPGCGKSLAAKAIASEWKKPLLRLDTGALFSARVGSSEENLRNAIQVAEAIAPCTLWIDEIDKSFSGSLNFDDGGVTARVLGGLITWLQEKTAPVFVIATANSINGPSLSGRRQRHAHSDGLPAELLRKGRFDELFFVDLPNYEERKSIFEVHLRKRGHGLSAFSLDELAEESDGFSGAEIEQAVLSAMYNAFDGLNRLYKLVQPNLERLNEEAASALKGFSGAELEEGWFALFTELFSEGPPVTEKSRAAVALQNFLERSLAEWPVERLLGLMTSGLHDEEPVVGLSQQAVLRSLRQIYPLSIMMKPQIEALRRWAKDNARSASRPSKRIPGQ
jgi:SpoVK/Ycf46/Vps4 family AAA+-type ATPase